VAKNEKFLGLKFCKEMKQLKKELKACDHHYLRCLKPNEEKKPNLFFSNFVFNQIQYLGVLATIQVRKNGYPTRRTYEDFYENYKLLLNRSVDITTIDYKDLCQEIIVCLIGEEEANNLKDQYLFGKTKIFMKQPFNQKLELRKIELMKQKIYSLSIIKVALIHLKKRQKHKRISDSINNIKNYLMANKYKIQIKNKKDKIKRIQSMYYTHIEKQKIMYINNVYYIIQNSLRIINAQKNVRQLKNLMSMVSLNLQMYYIKIKENNLIITKKVLDQIIEKAKEKYAYRQYNKVWNKINPYVLKILAAKRFRKYKREAQKI
jgi:myosin heavy subunit